DLGNDRARHVLGALNAVEGGIRLERDASHPRVQLFEPSRGADERATCAQHGNKMRDAPLGLLPDLVGGAKVVSTPVRVIGILIRIKILVGSARMKFAGVTDRAVRSLGRVGIDDVRAVSLQNALALDRN